MPKLLQDPAFYLFAIPAVVLIGLAKGSFSGLGALGMPLMALGVDPVAGAAILLPILIAQDVVGVTASEKHGTHPSSSPFSPARLWVLSSGTCWRLKFHRRS